MKNKTMILAILMLAANAVLAQYDWINRQLPICPRQDTTGIRWMKEYTLSTTIMGKRKIQQTTYYDRKGYTIGPLIRNAYDSLGRLTDRVEYTQVWNHPQLPDTLIADVYKIDYGPSGLIEHAGLLHYYNYGKSTMPDTDMVILYLLDTIYTPAERKYECTYLVSHTTARAEVWGEIPSTHYDTITATRILNPKGNVLKEMMLTSTTSEYDYILSCTYDRWNRLDTKVIRVNGMKDSVVYQYNSQHYPIGYNGWSWNEGDSAQTTMRCLPNGIPQQITEIWYSTQYDQVGAYDMEVQYTYHTYFDKRGNCTRREVPEAPVREYDYKYWDE